MLSDEFAGHWCYAHNGSGYDFRYLIAYLCRKRIPWEGFTAGSRWFVRTLDREFLDSMAVLPMSLREAAQKLGAPHQKHEVPEDFYTRIESYDWQTYLRGDLYALFACIDILRDSVDKLGAQLKRTLASTAVDLWQRRYLTGRYSVPGHDHPAEAAAREAYAGGRCEVFRPSMGPGEYWDINSSYPTQMLRPVPVEVERITNGPSIPESGLVYATWDIPHDEALPPLFWRGPTGRLYHPTGRWDGWRTVDEARYVSDLYGADAVKVQRSIAFRARDLFSSYCRALYAERLTPGPVGVVAKRLLNSLYGRTGMTRIREQIKSGPLPGLAQVKAGVIKMVSERHGVWTEETKAMLNNATIMPAVAATITARGRISLDRDLLRPNPARVYCDTDAGIVEGEAALTASKDLGGVKLEGKILDGVFVAPKAYRIRTAEGETVHVKGMPRRDVTLLRKYLDGGKVQVGRVPGIREGMRRGKDIDGPSEMQTRHHTAGGNRHPEGRAYRVEELAQ